MKTTVPGIGLLAALAALALPASAMAEYLVPPSNSAVNQYTETYPTGGGQKQASKSHRAEKHPAKVLGSRNARRLDRQGADGQAAAELAAATAPGGSGGGAGSGSNGGSRDNTAAGGSGSDGGAPAGSDERDANARPVTAAPQHGGDEASSGIGSVLSQATGSSSSGALGLMLPLAILAAIAWSVLYLVRQRKRPTA